MQPYMQQDYNANYYDREAIYGYPVDDIEFEQRLQTLERKQQQLQELAEPRGLRNPYAERQTLSAPLSAPQRTFTSQPTFAPEPTHIDVTSILCGAVIALIMFFFLKAIWRTR